MGNYCKNGHGLDDLMRAEYNRCPACLLVENAELRRKLEAMERARDGWRGEAKTRPSGHARSCDVNCGGCDCPAALDCEAEGLKILGSPFDPDQHGNENTTCACGECCGQCRWVKAKCVCGSAEAIPAAGAQ